MSISPISFVFFIGFLFLYLSYKIYPKKGERTMTLNCPRCNAPVFIKLPKQEWKNPRYPIYECQSCSYFEERFD